MGFIKRAFEFISRPSHSRTLGLVIFFILTTTLVLTVIVAQQQQQTKQRATGEDLPPICNSNAFLYPDSNDSIHDCTFTTSEYSSGNITCLTETGKCKIGNKIYECQKQ